MTTKLTGRVSEVEWQAAARAALGTTGWRYYIARPGRRTEPAPHTAGFPDLLCLRPPRAIVIEAKLEGGHVATAQTEWLDTFTACGIEAYLFEFPRDWQRFLDVIAPEPVQQTFTMNSTGVTPWNPITTGATGAGSVPLTPVMEV